MLDLKKLIELLVEHGAPPPKTIIEAKIYVNHQFPDCISRQAFLGAMTSELCEEFGLDFNKLIDSWKELYNE